MYDHRLDAQARTALARRFRIYLADNSVPLPLRVAMGRCLFRRWKPGALERVLAHLTEGLDAGEERFRGILRHYDIRDEQPSMDGPASRGSWRSAA